MNSHVRQCASVWRVTAKWLAASALSLALGLALPAAADSGGPSGASDASREYEIKAAFIYNFTKFVEWPSRSLPGASDPIVIAVLGDSPCAQALEQVTRGRLVNGHPILIKRVDSAKDAGTAQLLFVGSSQQGQFDRMAAALAAAPVLTVGESPSFAAEGAISFVRQEDKVRFEINLNAATKAGLKISAQLLKLATVVRGSG